MEVIEPIATGEGQFHYNDFSLQKINYWLLKIPLESLKRIFSPKLEQLFKEFLSDGKGITVLRPKSQR